MGFKDDIFLRDLGVQLKASCALPFKFRKKEIDRMLMAIISQSEERSTGNEEEQETENNEMNECEEQDSNFQDENGTSSEVNKPLNFGLIFCLP